MVHRGRCDVVQQEYNIQHLIYQQKAYEHHYKDYQFGLSTMRDHWTAGLDDIRKTLAVRTASRCPTTTRAS